MINITILVGWLVWGGVGEEQMVLGEVSYSLADLNRARLSRALIAKWYRKNPKQFRESARGFLVKVLAFLTPLIYLSIFYIFLKMF